MATNVPLAGVLSGYRIVHPGQIYSAICGALLHAVARSFQKPQSIKCCCLCFCEPFKVGMATIVLLHGVLSGYRTKVRSDLF